MIFNVIIRLFGIFWTIFIVYVYNVHDVFNSRLESETCAAQHLHTEGKFGKGDGGEYKIMIRIHKVFN